MQAIWSRRGLLAAIAATAGAADKDGVIPPEIRRFRDSATEFEFTSLTDPKAGASWVPVPPLRAMGRSNTLVYASDRSGSVQAYRMDLRSFQSAALTRAQQMDPQTLSSSPDGRTLFFFDGASLVQASGRRTRTLYTVEAGWNRVPGFAISEDSVYAGFVEQRESRYRMRVVSLRRGTASTLLEGGQPVRCMRFRPRRSALVYNYEGVLTSVNVDGGASQRLRIAEGMAGDAHWSADGERVHYLLTPAEPGKSVQLREIFVDNAEDKLVATTTQFVSFSRNSDSSVFAGVSGTKAAPYLLLLLRAGKRELTIAEHRASDPGKAAILFSPDSQRVIWQTDREGRSGIYMMALEKFIEKTTDDSI
jgi:oligogalacturonide lyase